VNLTKQERKPYDFNETKICAFCKCEFIYIGENPHLVKYCSEKCYKAASNSKTKQHRLKSLGTTEFSSHRIKDFKKEQKRIRLEKKLLHLS